jgi:FtsP/CotA-like multicopper oxidase with cupredoxin domain
LLRGEPVAITIVNHLPLPTSIHWHGIELDDSYMDGVPGFSGSGTHLTPAIAPGDSFVARFTPPRAGTFMYHAQVDDVREELAGLEGALIVRGHPAMHSPDDHVLFFKGVAASPVHPLEVNGHADPDTIVLHAGRAGRFRILNLSTFNPVAQVWLTARRDRAAQITDDSLLVRWRVMAKDGFDLPDAGRTPQPARRVVAIGETYDFEYTARQPGTLRLEFRTNGVRHPLLIRVPIRVE